MLILPSTRALVHIHNSRSECPGAHEPRTTPSTILICFSRAPIGLHFETHRLPLLVYFPGSSTAQTAKPPFRRWLWHRPSSVPSIQRVPNDSLLLLSCLGKSTKRDSGRAPNNWLVCKTKIHLSVEKQWTATLPLAQRCSALPLQLPAVSLPLEKSGLQQLQPPLPPPDPLCESLTGISFGACRYSKQ